MRRGHSLKRGEAAASSRFLFFRTTPTDEKREWFLEPFAPPGTILSSCGGQESSRSGQRALVDKHIVKEGVYHANRLSEASAAGNEIIHT